MHLILKVEFDVIRGIKGLEALAVTMSGGRKVPALVAPSRFSGQRRPRRRSNEGGGDRGGGGPADTTESKNGSNQRRGRRNRNPKNNIEGGENLNDNAEVPNVQKRLCLYIYR